MIFIINISTLAHLLPLAFLGALAACSSETSSMGAGGHGGGDLTTIAGSGGGGKSSGETSSGDGGGGGQVCDAKLDGACGSCMKGACCDALTACEGDMKCLACVNAEDSDACESSEATHARVDAFLQCKGGACTSDCIGSTSSSCEGLLENKTSDACSTCLEASCCQELANCNANAVCWDGCLFNHEESKCHGDPNGHALFHAFGACMQGSCAAECSAGPVIEPACDAPSVAPSNGSCFTLTAKNLCNPVTNEGCVEAGAACDRSESGDYVCFPPPNTNALCATCGSSAGWCAPGNVCASGTCARYCCTDGDCGAGKCDTASIDLGGVGICVAP